MKNCPKCNGQEWPDDCEQGVSIEWHGECVCCKFTNKGSNSGTRPELDAVAAEAQKRRNTK